METPKKSIGFVEVNPSLAKDFRCAFEGFVDWGVVRVT